MIQQQKKDLVEFWMSSGLITDMRVLDAFDNIPREAFLQEKSKGQAYLDQPLQIPRGKTISQPTTVLMMTQALEIKPGDKILEVGSGSGYQAAILGHLVGETGQIFTTEVLPELVDYARENIQKLNLKNIVVFEQDGTRGLPQHAPFDKIIITASGKDFPDELIEQLKEGGLIIGPIGDQQEQEMVLGIKQGVKLDLDFLGQFLFSPLAGKYGFDED